MSATINAPETSDPNELGEIRKLWWRGHEPRLGLVRNTTPSLKHQLPWLLGPLTKAGRETQPGWYLSNRPREISEAPRSATLGEKTKRHVVMAANLLWWPIARFLTVFFLWRDGLDPRTAVAWWRAIAVLRDQKAKQDQAAIALHPAAFAAPGPGRATSTVDQFPFSLDPPRPDATKPPEARQ